MPQPKWLADPTHRQKVFAKKFFAAANPPSKANPVQKADAIRLKKYFGYWVKQNRDKSLEEMKRTRHAPLNHLFGDHSLCGNWCPRKRNPTAPIPPNQYYRSKEAHAKSWAAIKKLYDPFFEDDKLEEMRHPFETQVNESLNVAIMMLAPKHKTYSKSMSLHNRVLICAGVKNMGFGTYWRAVYDELGIEITSSSTIFLEKVASDKTKLKKRKQSTKFKKERAERNSKAELDERKRVIKCMAQGMGYGEEDRSQVDKEIPLPSAAREEIEQYLTSNRSATVAIQNLVKNWKAIDSDVVKGISKARGNKNKIEFLLNRADEYKGRGSSNDDDDGGGKQKSATQDVSQRGEAGARSGTEESGFDDVANCEKFDGLNFNDGAEVDDDLIDETLF